MSEHVQLSGPAGSDPRRNLKETNRKQHMKKGALCMTEAEFNRHLEERFPPSFPAHAPTTPPPQRLRAAFRDIPRLPLLRFLACKRPEPT